MGSGWPFPLVHSLLALWEEQGPSHPGLREVLLQSDRGISIGQIVNQEPLSQQLQLYFLRLCIWTLVPAHGQP